MYRPVYAGFQKSIHALPVIPSVTAGMHIPGVTTAVAVVSKVPELIFIPVRSIVPVAVVAAAVKVAVQVAFLGIVIVGVIAGAVAVAGTFKIIRIGMQRISPAYLIQVIFSTMR